MQLIAFVAAAGFAIFELSLSRVDRRIDASLEYAARFTEGEVAKQRRILDRAWYESVEEYEALRRVTSVPDGQELAFAQAFFKQHILTKAGAATENGTSRDIDLRLAIAEIADTLDQLALCVTPPPCDSFRCRVISRPRCHAPTARMHFCTYALSFTRLYAPVLEEIEKKLDTPPLGKAAHAFATTPECLELRELP